MVAVMRLQLSLLLMELWHGGKRMEPFLDDWLNDLEKRRLAGERLSPDDAHRLHLLHNCKRAEFLNEQPNQMISWGARWLQAIKRLRGDG
jgi:hypothetical protein